MPFARPHRAGSVSGYFLNRPRHGMLVKLFFLNLREVDNVLEVFRIKHYGCHGPTVLHYFSIPSLLL